MFSRRVTSRFCSMRLFC